MENQNLDVGWGKPKGYYFSENSLRGYCHIKFASIKRKVRQFKEAVRAFTKRDWYNPMGVVVLLLLLVMVVMLVVDVLQE